VDIYAEIKRCALYEDYHGLVNRVEPKLEIIQEQQTMFLKEHRDMTAVVNSFDMSLSTKASKTDIIGLEKLLRGQVKDADFLHFKESTEKII